MDNIIKQIREILGNHYTSQISIHILADEIYFGIYESEVIIIVDLKGKDVYVDSETMVHHLSSNMLDELSRICRLVEENLDVIEDLLVFDED